ncbi:hypothetical protein [Haloarcula amylovorans]|uniref:hypothetical protein n=1 Tax=Haloarcula amylovorans TaxID=2562280 RepID=UPI001431C169|nr:hypothetical protein [Halomicroarcula amylolytica]
MFLHPGLHSSRRNEGADAADQPDATGQSSRQPHVIGVSLGLATVPAALAATT